jgi:hypothetical protein
VHNFRPKIGKGYKLETGITWENGLKIVVTKLEHEDLASIQVTQHRDQ